MKNSHFFAKFVTSIPIIPVVTRWAEKWAGWSQNVNDNSGGGEGDFNGLSLVAVLKPSSLALACLGLAGLPTLRRRK